MIDQRMTPPQRTRATPEDMIHAIWQAHQDVIGGPCPVNLLELLVAQSALETGRWQSMWCFNCGNIRGHAPDGAWTSIKGASEIENGKEVFYDVGPDNKFAAYRDAVDGARAFVRFLGTASHPPEPNRYQGAWDAAISGDVVGYCAELKKHGYFTANLEQYSQGVRGTRAWLRAGPIPAFLATLARESTPP